MTLYYYIGGLHPLGIKNPYFYMQFYLHCFIGGLEVPVPK